MLNVIKMDFYRLFKTKSFYITQIIYLAVCALNIWSYSMIQNMSSSSDNGIVITTTSTFVFSDYMNTLLCGGTAILFVVIFTVIFCGGEFKKGYIKNIASIVSKKQYIIISKTIIILFYTLIMHILTIIVGYVGVGLIAQEDTSIDLSKLFIIAGIEILLCMAIALIVEAIFMLTRKSIIAMIGGIVYIYVGGIVYIFLNFLVSHFTKYDDFDISKYTALGNMTININFSASHTDFIRSMIVGVIITAIGITLSIISINKKDIV